MGNPRRYPFLTQAPVKVTGFRNRVFADVIKDLEVRSSWT